jgi:voltage-gated potassium channel Kch
MAADLPPARDEGQWLIWTLLVAAVAFVLGVIGQVIYLPGEQRFLDLAYHSLQLFVLGSDPLRGSGPYNPFLEIARFVAPATTVYTVFRAFRSVLREGLRRRAIGRLAEHVVVTGDSVASLVLASNLRASGVRVVLVGGEAAEVARRQGIPVVPGDAREITTLRAAGVRGASALYACAPRTATNAAVVLAAAEIDGRDRRLEAYAQVHSDELVEALRVRQVAAVAHGRRVTIDFFSLEDIAARQLLDRYPPTAASVVIVGFGVFGQALLRALVRRPDPEGRSLSITVWTDDADRVVELVAQLEQWEGRSIQVRPRQAADAVKADSGSSSAKVARRNSMVSGVKRSCSYRSPPHVNASTRCSSASAQMRRNVSRSPCRRARATSGGAQRNGVSRCRSAKCSSLTTCPGCATFD